jgi:NADPH-dependent glutamate synthase beta subunit-like oxidoreductase
MTEHPVFVDLLPPCNFTCPAGEDIQGWMSAASAGDYHQAWSALVRHNPLPAVMGRVCYHPCESNCNRAQFDQPVNIHAVERFLGDEAIRQGWQFDPPAPSTGKHVLVVGAGPAGLSAAYHLRRVGHDATIRDAAPRAGGMMRYGIPRYRLPRNILDAEIARIEAMGVAIQLDRKVTGLTEVLNEFDAVFLAVGAHIAKRTQIPAHDASRIMDAVKLLRGMETGVTPVLGRRVLIYGGGNTALDVARTAKRLGASETLIVYRRTREKMPAQEFEVQEALDEGVVFQWLSTVKMAGEEAFRIDHDFFTIEKMWLDESGFPQPTGKFETIPAGTLILALGQDADLSFLEGVPGIAIENGVVKVDQHMMTGCPGVFAGGDMVPANRTVTVGIGHGKKAARNIDAYLNSDAYLRSDVYKPPPKHEVATFDRLNTRRCDHAARATQPVLDMDRRLATFEEVFGGLDLGGASHEARRCLACGNCHECDNCYEICPGDAVVKLGPGKHYRFVYENCDGCGLCAGECPCGAIVMQVN